MSTISHNQTSNSEDQFNTISQKYLMCLYDKHWGIERVHLE